MHIDVNSSKVVEHANRLEKIHKYAFPNAVKGTLNSAAFFVKKTTLQDSAERNFVKRSPNFFKTFSRVEMAKGNNVNQMQSTIGMMEQGLKGDKNFAVKDLEQQEGGGSIGGKSFIPTDKARGGSRSKPVRPGNRMTLIKKKIVDAKHGTGANYKERFVKSVIHAGVGGFVLGDLGNKRTLWRVNSLNRTKSGLFKLSAIYSYKKSRAVKVNKTNFMQEAAYKSADKLEDFFILEAQRQFEKYR